MTVAATEQIAVNAIHQCLRERAFGSAGDRIVIEEFLVGEEASFICLVDGEFALPLATSQDHKARDAKDQGPNTGGMGAYSPAPVITEQLHQRIMREIVRPTIEGLSQDGHIYTGFLYTGLMIGHDKTPKVLEYNCRFGDPETQPILMRLKSDLASLCEAALDHRLEHCPVEWDERAALGVVMACGGYPGEYQTGNVIHGLDDYPEKNVKIFHAGTSERNGQLYTAGGRVLCVTALGASIESAQNQAYASTRRFRWTDAYYRNDIGYRALQN